MVFKIILSNDSNSQDTWVYYPPGRTTRRSRVGYGSLLIDPSEHGVIRIANNVLVPDGDTFLLPFGITMPSRSDLDTTGSMGRNVDIAFGVLPKIQKLLVEKILNRYCVQIATGVVQDRTDRYPFRLSQFERDNEIDRQMQLMFPEKDGGDATEDYQIGLFSAAYLTKTRITEYGLKGYYFAMGDERGRDELEMRVLYKVFGKSFREKLPEEMSDQELPSTTEVGQKVLEKWHAFFLQVNNTDHTTYWWSKILGAERVISLPQTEDIAEVQAVIIGLTEGVLDLQNAVDFLTNDAKISKSKAQQIVRAVASIPIGAQAALPNFNKIPLKGARFQTREDVWPMDASVGKVGKKKPDTDWKL